MVSRRGRWDGAGLEAHVLRAGRAGHGGSSVRLLMRGWVMECGCREVGYEGREVG